MSISDLQKSIIHLSTLGESCKAKDIKKELSLFEAIIQNNSLVQESSKVLYCLEKITSFTDLIADESKSNELKERIFRITSLYLDTLDYAKIEMPDEMSRLVFIADIDASDRNGAMSGILSKSIKCRLPVIVTSSILFGSNVKSYHSQKRQIDLRASLYENYDDYDVYWSKHHDYALFLPKGHESFESLGLDSEQFLKVDSFAQIFKEQKGSPPTLNQFMDLFNLGITARKHILLAGHGGKTCIGGLTKSKYKELLTFCQATGTENFNVISCSGGDVNLFHHTCVDGSTPNFSVNVFSIGSFPTNSLDKIGILTNVFSDFEEFKKQQYPHVSALAQASKIKFIQVANLPLIRFPGKGPLQPFRPWGNGIPSFTLTHNKLIAAKLLPYQLTGRDEHVPEPQSSQKAVLKVNAANIVELYPLHLDVPVAITKSAPFIHSMVPGNCHHLIDSLRFDFHPQYLMLSAREYCFKSKVQKAFIINKMHAAGREYTDAMLYYSNQECRLLYKRDGMNYIRSINQTGKQTVQTLSDFEYNAIFYQLTVQTTPDQENIARSAGERESTLNLKEKITGKKQFKTFKLLQGSLIKQPTLKKCNKMLRTSKCSAQELFEAALLYNQSEIALVLLEHHSIALNKTGGICPNLMASVIGTRNLALIRRCIALGGNTNLFATLTAAVATQEKDIVSLVLSKQWLIGSQMSNVLLLAKNLEVIKILVKAGADPHVKNEKGIAFSQLFIPRTIVEYQSFKSHGLLFDRSAILISALKSGKRDYVQFLLQEGVDVLKLSHQGELPFAEAAICSPAIFSLLVKHLQKKKAFNKACKKVDRFGNNALVKAYTHGARRNFKLLKTHGPKSCKKVLFQQALLLRDYKTAKSNLSCIAKSQIIEHADVGNVFHKDQLRVVRYLIENNYECSLTNLKFIESLIKDSVSFDVDLFKKCFKNYRCNTKDNGANLLFFAHQMNNLNAFTALLECGVNPHRHKSLLVEIVSKGKTDFFDQCLQHSSRFQLRKLNNNEFLKIAKKTKQSLMVKKLRQLRKQRKKLSLFYRFKNLIKIVFSYKSKC